jgi:uncharacterized membrane protein HdeD (DUF308 family)
MRPDRGGFAGRRSFTGKWRLLAENRVMSGRRCDSIQTVQQPTGATQMNARIKDPSTVSLLAGVALVTAGVLLTRQPAGLLHSVDLAHSWPMIFIVLAFVQLVATLKERHQQGWGLLLAGDWLLANTMTDWAYIQFSVPVLLAGLGLMTIVRGLRDHSRRSDEDYRATQ